MRYELKQGWNLPQRWLRFPIITLLILGIFFRFVNLDRSVIWYDEAFTFLRISGYTEAEVVQRFAEDRNLDAADLQKYQQANSDKGLADTVKSLALEEPQLSPLYYVMAWFWMHWFGNSLLLARSLSAIISLFAFPSIYWLCLELFVSPLVGWIAVAIVAVSPFDLLFAQVARQYSLWIVTILLSSAAILRAMRLNTKLSWGIYATTVAAGLYSHLAFGLVAIGHGIYVFITEKFRLSKSLIYYLIASSIGLLTFTPWLVCVVTSSKQIEQDVAKTEAQPLLYLLKEWSINTSSIFIDFNFDYVRNEAKYFLILPILTLIVYSIYFLYRQAPKQAWIFIYLLIGITALFITLPDLIFHTSRSVTSRYMIPCYLGIQISVAYLLIAQSFNRAFSGNSRVPSQIASSVIGYQQKLWRFILVVLLSGGILSCAMISQAEAWWNKGFNYYYPQVARVINQATRPLIITDTKTGRILSLSHMIAPTVRIEAQPFCRTCRASSLHMRKNLLDVSQGYSVMFLLSPFKKLRARLEKKYKIESVYVKGELWRLKQ